MKVENLLRKQVPFSKVYPFWQIQLEIFCAPLGDVEKEGQLEQFETIEAQVPFVLQYLDRYPY